MIALITPTGSRKDQFLICTKLMKRQTYTGDVLWIIVDDGYPSTIDVIDDDFRDNWTIVKLFPEPKWRGQNTQARNLKAGTDYLRKNYSEKDIQAIFIIEDDDYYSPQYLEKMMSRMLDFDVLGETDTIYYNVQWRMYVINRNRGHASLFQTAFTYRMIPLFESCFAHKFIDAAFWQRAKNKHLFIEAPFSVGIKGMPGRGGIGAGHRASMYMSRDIEMRYLTKIIGDDAKLYERYYRDHSQSQHPLFVKRRV